MRGNEGVDLNGKTGDFSGSEEAGSIIRGEWVESILTVLCVVSRRAWLKRSASLVDIAGEKDTVRAVGEEHQRGVSRLPENLEGRVGSEELEGFIIGVVDAEHVHALGDGFVELCRGKFAIRIIVVGFRGSF